ncbi:hypothetical protein ACQEVF_16520 [Nonomuraea polychroma]|uniref:hypothetical protein n=1 Tax=Nonomuraea polychroma TaxID=46176 RepID=UPI003D8CBF8A
MLMLDRAGRTLVAHQDLERPRIMLATCDGGRCVRTPVAAMRNHPGSRLALTLDGRGRPVIAWEDGTGDLSDGDWQLMLSTVLRHQKGLPSTIWWIFRSTTSAANPGRAGDPHRELENHD